MDLKTMSRTTQFDTNKVRTFYAQNARGDVLTIIYAKDLHPKRLLREVKFSYALCSKKYKFVKKTGRDTAIEKMQKGFFGILRYNSKLVEGNFDIEEQIHKVLSCSTDLPPFWVKNLNSLYVAYR